MSSHLNPPADVPPIDDSLPTVRAAGGVLWRRDPQGNLEVALVHRPRYDDWSFPKGKQDPGESDEQTAVREVLEETGYEVRVALQMVPLDYVLPTGQRKVVVWFSMEAVGGEFTPNDEVDRIEWLPPEAATERLTRGTDSVLIKLVAGLHGG
jgi:8-oxo-dGTP pyrophosphatase MutT (NUDIX family)